ncbi:unnamed protein product [Schistosoma mattheei]|uniref:Uncharacterized protein n=1 Tax=Schistosoma mattheei TaxID=31246 RepID=A0A183PLH2_9TREM|nr:unnamed protein product [Schistosoma mattheei]
MKKFLNGVNRKFKKYKNRRAFLNDDDDSNNNNSDYNNGFVKQRRLEPAIFRPKNFVLRIFYKVPDENSIQKSTSMDMNQQTPFQSSDLNSSSLLKQMESSNIAVCYTC